MEPDRIPLTVEDKLAELKAAFVGLYGLMRGQQAETKAELARLRDANAHMQRDIQGLQAALSARFPTLAAHLPVQSVHQSVPGARPPESEREHKQGTTHAE